MKISDIRAYPTTYVDADRGTCHESLLRSFHIVHKVKELCEENTSPKVIAELIEEMEASDD